MLGYVAFMLKYGYDMTSYLKKVAFILKGCLDIHGIHLGEAIPHVVGLSLPNGECSGDEIKHILIR